MAALTLEQLRARSRAKFPVTVVHDEDYTVLTPTQIADAWTAYSGGTVGVRLKDTDDVWYAMDADLPKANGRGLFIFGGGKQYAKSQDWAVCTVGQPLGAEWPETANGMTLTYAAKGTEYGLPYVDVDITGTSTSTAVYLSFPGSDILAAEFAANDTLVMRATMDVRALPAQVTVLENYVYINSPFAAEINLFTVTTGLKVDELTWTIPTDNDVVSITPVARHASAVTYASALTLRLFPFFYTINTAYPEHMLVVNTSTTTAATIVPEIMQRPWEYEGPWSVEIEVELAPPRNLGDAVIAAMGAEWANSTYLQWNATTNLIALYSIVGGQVAGQVTGPEIDPGDTVKAVIYQTAQVTKLFVNGNLIDEVATGRTLDGSECLGHIFTATSHSFATYKSLVYRTGLATDAQLEEWSTLS